MTSPTLTGRTPAARDAGDQATIRHACRDLGLDTCRTVGIASGSRLAANRTFITRSKSMAKILRTEPNAIMSKAVEYHGFVFTQGVVARDLSLDVSGQTKDVLAQLDALLEEHGTESTRILQAQIWLKDIADRDAFNVLWQAWVPSGEAPARACVQAVLANPQMLVEVMLITTK